MEQVQRRLRELGAERRALIEDIRRFRRENKEQSNLEVENKPEVYPASTDAKVRLFLKRFGARRDLYPRRWENAGTGRAGYFPVVKPGWENGHRLKPSEIFKRFGVDRFEPLNERVIEQHLRGIQTVGTYAIGRDDSCIFLAADFDGEGWEVDASGFCDVAAELGVHSLIERSRSGKGAHVWVFMAEPVPAVLARTLGAIVLQRVAGRNPGLRLDTYDRFFPNQDSLPKGGFGNLIALPLQKQRREFGFTEFVDDSLTPYPDQWAALAEVGLLQRNDLESIIEDCLLTEVTDGPARLDLSETIDESEILDPLNLPRVDDWRMILNERLVIPTKGLPASVISRLKLLATFSNPVFFEKQRLRFPTYNIPRYLFCGELHADHLVLPRGILEDVIECFASCGSRLEVEDRRLSIRNRRWRFTGELTSKQNPAVAEIIQHEYGVLVAPPGSGKTVIACAWIGKLKVSTLVLVNRQVLLEQWRATLSKMISVEPGAIGMWKGNKKKLTGKIDVVMMQSLVRVPDVRRFFRDYDAVVIDECHHVPAVTFEALMKECGSRHILGLTATPKRKDRLERLLHFEGGPVRYRIDEESGADLSRTAFVRTTLFSAHRADGLPMHLHEIWDALVHDKERNEQIAEDLNGILDRMRVPLVVSDRKEHLRILAEETRHRMDDRNVVLEVVDGSQSQRRREEALKRFEGAIADKKPAVLFATASLLGEGFDLPILNSLLLAMPISFRGRLVQYAGRLHRRSPGKTSVEVYDYLDERMPVTASMYRKRLPGYREMGYRIERGSR